MIFCKSGLFALSFVLVSYAVSSSSSIIIKTTRIIGKGPFKQVWVCQSSAHSEDFRHEKVTGIPQNLSNVVVCGWNTDDAQFNAELARENLLPENAIGDTSGAFPGHVNQQIAFLSATDSAGDLVVIFDTNNNQDFSDEKPRVVKLPSPMQPSDTLSAHF